MTRSSFAPLTQRVHAEHDHTDTFRRDWFLRDSTWIDDCWIFAPTSILEEERPVCMRWDFMLPGGRRFTDPSCATLLESAKKLIALTRVRSPGSGLAQRAATVRIYFNHLRTLIRWMDKQGFVRFADLDAAALLSFQRAIEHRAGRHAKTVMPTTVERHLRVLSYLHRHCESVGDGLSFDPWPGRSAHAAAGVRNNQRRSRTHTPDVVAVALIQGAIEFLTTSAVDVLRVRELYAATMTRAGRRGLRKGARHELVLKALRTQPIRTPRGPYTVTALSDFAELMDLLYAACFAVIAYLVGARVSEILQLRSGCVRPLLIDGADTHSDVAVIAGAIFKLEPDYHGRAHEWVAPPPAVHAISVLEALSAPHRLRAARPELWLRSREHGLRANEWQRECSTPLWVPGTTRINKQLARLAEWLALPPYEEKRWRLSTHQGRKTFARFVALRDRTSLFALAQHLGHRDRAITDAGYVGNDYRLNDEIDTAVIEQSVSAWEHMLSAPQLGGRAGVELLAKRPRFRGTSMKQDLKSYARTLVEAGLTLGVCDWGFCVYRQEYSACRGDALGPNAAHREPSTCARCKNFVVSGAHRPYWLDQARRYEALLKEPALPTQTLKIARQRLAEALTMLRSIDTTSRTDRNDRKA